MRLLDTMSMWIGRVEIALAGADSMLRDGQEALARGDAMVARAQAKAILERLPESPLGLALLADACEAGGLEAELLMTLEELSQRAPSRADVWSRLGSAREHLGESRDARDAYLRALAIAEGGSDARRESLLGLADLDLAAKDGARAGLWLERLASKKSPDVATRQAEACILQGDPQRALSFLAPLADEPTNGRLAFARGQALAMMHDAECFPALLRAYMLDAIGASEALSSAVAWIAHDDATRARVRDVVEAKGDANVARFRAAFARAAGLREEARAALRDAVFSGDRSASEPLFDAAIEDRDRASLDVALAAMPNETAIVIEARALSEAAREPDAHRRLVALERITHGKLDSWADALRKESIASWLAPSIASWDAIFSRLDELARKLHDLPASARIAELATDRARPVRVAIVGEFNAGKSTFINVVLGADIAPTGVLPTTATLHHLRYARDPIAKICFTPPEPDRLLALSDLRPTLKSLDAASVTRVEILVALPSLLRVEILDTPGFNAPDQAHAAAARRAFEEADLALWLLDASQAMKQSERKILDEARARNLPVQILVNKADRLKGDDIAKVMSLVTTSLVDVGIESWAAPLAFSAKLALEAKTTGASGTDGDASGWTAVESLFEKEIVLRSNELKERGIRRRAALVAQALAKTAEAAKHAGEERALARVDLATRYKMAAARIDRDADTQSQMLAGAVRRDFDRWQSEIAALFLGRDEAQMKVDPELQKYRIDRALVLVAPALARVLSRMTETDDAGKQAPALLFEADLISLTRAAVRGFSVHDAGDLQALARACVAMLTELLASRALAPDRKDESMSVVAEVSAFTAVFSPDASTSSTSSAIAGA